MAAPAARPRHNPHRAPTFDSRPLRPGQVDPATGQRIPGTRGGVPRHLDGTPMTDEEVEEITRRELDPTPRERAADTARAGVRRAGSVKPPTLGRVGRRAAGAASIAPGRLRTDASGFILAVLFWGWIALPALQGGPDRVKATLRAKFFNKGPDGQWLP